MSGDNSVPVYYDPNRPIKQESPKYHPLGSQMNPISSPYYKDDPFSILLDNPIPESHPQSYDTSSQWMDAGSDFSNWNTATAESSHTQHNMSTEEDPSEESHHYEPVYENPEDFPFFDNTSGNSDH
ncbi:hypothetical protein L1987_48023 [Smallanthus sonchifolius]|uniref:Uncharacterized protein n=1 Tax=Smallanthus sonchifolius TaxID=185202 RepID=A0ACB9FRQ8_9ASTR|nr:hypothetical protein L1987_48023 [Smallanthus sonchifolius]